MTLVKLSPLGRLTQFVAIPPQVEKPAGSSPSPDWAPLFSAAELDPSKWLPAQPAWTPPVYGDARAAWTGSLAERPEIPMRIEAAAYQGKPVYFELIGPWTRPERMQASEKSSLPPAMVLLLSLLVGGGMLARRNLRLGRGDRRGAFRLAVFVFAVWAMAWLCGTHHVPDFDEFALFIEFLVRGFALSCFLWFLYIALEPYVRRRWPATLVSWSRLLAGGFRDPLVGRDVLAGSLTGASSTALGSVGWFVPLWLGYPPVQPRTGPTWQFLGARTTLADISHMLIVDSFFWLTFLFVLVLLRVLLRKEWIAIAIMLLFPALGIIGSRDPGLSVSVLVFSGVAVFLLLRFGLLALVANYIVWYLLTNFPLTIQGSAWYAGISLIAILLMAAITFYGFYISLGDRPVFGSAVLEE